ncbi:hypothetical protein [Methylovulum psychrotolerans]|uniref:DUF2489 domain-containing protein n=1 Tax=Methylovulum psychrotolerans TaxID=1704499 RepID=A0A2S5CFI3_9GAMM|nr:hypothetical protein [Methylovulum psychrotolerans]POZ49565.1 hypothetical protein AADEFJLK_04666 [Methylovulum psychrotolerans]
MQNDFDIHDKIIEVTEKLINDEIDYVEGARFIVDNRFGLSGIDESIFYFFISVVSETETMPDKDNRKNFSATYLSISDQDKEAYYQKISDTLKNACFVLLGKIKQQ